MPRARACSRFKASLRFWRQAPPPRSPWFHWRGSSLSWPGNQRHCPLPNSRPASCFWPATPSPAPTQQQPPPAQQPSVEAHPPPAPPPAALATETAPPVVPSQPAAAAVAPVAEPRPKETPPQDGSTQGEEEETEGPQAVATATTNLNSAKAEAKLVKALDYLVAINDHSDNPAQKWVINESILASLPAVSGPR
jgi:type IV secretory pathway VirB10-like protein